MPQNLVIAAFVLGAVLLLISLVGGRFKIFGAEISGTAGRTGRFIAFVIGVALIIVGLYPQQLKPDHNNDSPQLKADSSSQVVPPARAPSVQPIESSSSSASQPADAHSSKADAQLVVSNPVQSTRRLDVEWQDGTQELQGLVAGLPPQEQTNLGLSVLLLGTDIYGALALIIRDFAGEKRKGALKD